ncbi:bifunctional DNA primase/polymerase [Streptomyces cavernicola]|uniref:Bifunctional DNA primase/polymerase n=1 Tax=Streptomyces cavernicola TaxID=3043613 RepID=A0ABT6SD05_9ACTN|nr:bifunctional DNA primase/polymerase [Streptomyces sp. B-S-A6]MDI3406060.1 bifunctional DNA primase/polymerase [Streptomyces sp. B-S-A6]
MTHTGTIRRDRLRPTPAGPLATALALAAGGVPVLPLRKGKVPFANCPACLYSRCGGRPNMKDPGPCTCASPCHGWAATTTDPSIINSPAWEMAWREGVAVAYHPGGAGLTVVDLDDAEAIAWARASLPPTRTVATTRGEHWIYQGTMRSVNGVRDGVDIKSTMSYVRWLGPGTGSVAPLPAAVRALAAKEPTTARPMPQGLAMPEQTGECRHRTPAYLERGIAMAEQRIADAPSTVHNTVYATFLAVLSTHGRCGCLTEAHAERLFTAAQAKGESLRHCSDAWANARTKLGL